MDRTAQIVAMIRMLEGNGEIAHEASLTGALADGRSAMVKTYNHVLDSIDQLGVVDRTLFPRLSEDTSIDEMGVYSHQLANYITAYFGVRVEEGQSGVNRDALLKAIDAFFEAREAQ